MVDISTVFQWLGCKDHFDRQWVFSWISDGSWITQSHGFTKTAIAYAMRDLEDRAAAYERVWREFQRIQHRAAVMEKRFKNDSGIRSWTSAGWNLAFNVDRRYYRLP